MPLAGDRLPYLDVARLAYEAGIPLGSEDLVIATAIVEYESRRFVGAWNFNDKTGDRSYGLWQINVGLSGAQREARVKAYGVVKETDLYDPATNARCMVMLFRQAGESWRYWGAYTNGRYKLALRDARTAVETLRMELGHPAPVPASKPVTRAVTPVPAPVKEVADVAGREAMIRAMESVLGLGEPNKIQSWYRARNGSAYAGNFAWCDATITWAAVQSGNHQAVCFGTDYAYTVAHAARFQAKGAWHPMVNGVAASGIRRGDIVFFDWAGGSGIGGIDHVGIVTSVSGGTVYTIEGNIGDRCARKVRYVRDIAGFGRPVYAAAPAPKPPPPPSGLPTASLAACAYALTHREADEKKRPLAAMESVRHMQDALVRMGVLGSGLYATGIGDQRTKNAYIAWQKRCGYTGPDADGVPGPASFNKLGADSKKFRPVA